MHLLKDVADEIKTIEKVKPNLARELALSFRELDKVIGDWDKASLEDIEKAINELGGDEEAKKRLKEMSEEQKASKLLNLATCNSYTESSYSWLRKKIDVRPIDALAVGLGTIRRNEQQGIANQVEMLQLEKMTRLSLVKLLEKKLLVNLSNLTHLKI